MGKSREVTAHVQRIAEYINLLEAGAEFTSRDVVNNTGCELKLVSMRLGLWVKRGYLKSKSNDGRSKIYIKESNIEVGGIPRGVVCDAIWKVLIGGEKLLQHELVHRVELELGYSIHKDIVGPIIRAWWKEGVLFRSKRGGKGRYEYFLNHLQTDARPSVVRVSKQS